MLQFADFQTVHFAQDAGHVRVTSHRLGRTQHRGHAKVIAVDAAGRYRSERSRLHCRLRLFIRYQILIGQAAIDGGSRDILGRNGWRLRRTVDDVLLLFSTIHIALQPQI